MVPRIVRCSVTFLWLVFGFAAAAHAQSQVYVMDAGRSATPCTATTCRGPRIALVSGITGRTLARIDLTPGVFTRGTALRLSSDGSLLYVTTDTTTGVSGELLVVDAINKRLSGRVTVGLQPSDVAVLPDNSRAYVVNTAGNSVSVVDLSSLTVIATVAVQSAPSRAVVSADGNSVYVTNNGSDTVSRIATSNNTIAATIPVGRAPSGLDISPDGSRIFVANTQGPTVSVIDAQNDSVLRNLAVPSIGVTTTVVGVSAQSATRIYVTLSGFRVTAAHYLDATTGADLADLGAAGGLARNATGTPLYIYPSNLLKRVVDGTATSVPLEPGVSGFAAAVLTDPCAFVATASPPAFGLGGGSGTLTIPAPSGCSWTLNASAATGVTLGAGSLSGTGPATRSFTLAPAAAPDFTFVEVGRQSVSIEHTVPLMSIDYPQTTTVNAPFNVVGWAIDQNAVPDGDSGVDAVHVYALPASGAPIFVGAAPGRTGRSDVGAAYGGRYSFSGFDVLVSGLAPETYTIVCYARSSRSGLFNNARSITLNVLAPLPPITTIDVPTEGAIVGTSFSVAGWAIEPSYLGSGFSISVVHIWAYDSNGSTVFLGQQTLPGLRPDVGAAYGGRFSQSGFSVPVTLNPGSYTLAAFAQSALTGQFTAATRRITILPLPSDVRMNVDLPAQNAVISGPFTVAGWSLDRLVTPVPGKGIDAIHVWAVSVPAPGGGAPTSRFLGAASGLIARPDVASIFGPQYNLSGFGLTGATLPPGTYDLTVYVRSTATGAFNNSRTVRIVVQ